MITYKIKEYSSQDIIEKAAETLDKERIYDYEVSERVSRDNVSVEGCLSGLVIWIPESMEFIQYAIDDCIREMIPYGYTNVRSEGKYYRMDIKSRLTPTQFVKLLKTIIKESEFVTLVDK